MGEKTKNDDAEALWPGKWWLTALWLLIAIAFICGLNLPLVGPDEPRYAQVAREMYEAGNWITPTLGGHNWFEKPALLYWLQIAAYSIFGVTEFAARLGPAVFGVATVIAVAMFARLVATRTGVGEFHGFSFMLTLLAGSTLSILVFSHAASFDIIVTFPVTAALLCFYAYDQGAGGRRESGQRAQAWLAGFYFFTGVALLAKGLIGIIFPFAVVALYFALSRRWPTRAFVASVVWGTVLACGVAAIWYVPVYWIHGWDFVDQFFIQHHFQRFTSNRYQHPQPFYFYLWVLPLMLLPWTPFFLGGVISYLRRIFRGHLSVTDERDLNSSSLARLAGAWMIVPLVFFSLSGSKLPGYILPIVPPAIIMTALYLSRLASKNRAWRNVALAVGAATLTGAIFIALLIAPGYANGESVKSLISAADAAGHANERVVGLHTVSQNAEFYAAGRLVRDDDGRQRRLTTIAEVEEIAGDQPGARLLVLIPVEYASQLASQPRLVSRFIADNGELAIFSVSLISP